MSDRPGNRSPILFLSLIAALLLSVSGAEAQDAESDTAPDALVLSDCELLGSGGYAALDARCGRLTVPENPQAPGGRQITLFVAVLPAQSRAPATDAFTFLAGGPGQAATTAFVDIAQAFKGIRRDRDIVLIDQRGTGKSSPLECAEEEELMGITPSDAQLLASIRNCLQGLQGDPRYYTTTVAVQDIERVRKALGYSQLNVYGGSYGTRVGLHYLRKYPDSVRTLILDGVAPADLNLGPGIALAAQDALDNVFRRCAATAACASRFGDVGDQFSTLQARLNTGPISIRLPDPVSGVPKEVAFDYQRFAVAIRLLSYAPESVALMPLLLHEAAIGDYPAPLAAQAVMIEESLSQALSFGMHNSVVCTEDAPFYSEDKIDRAALRATYLGESQLDLLKNICSIWPAGVIDPDFKSPVVSELPILLLSGSADPVTPPAYAERAALTLDNHLHLIGKDMGHILAPVGCVPQLISTYVEEASLAGIDATCLEKIRPTPFFTSFNGPQP